MKNAAAAYLSIENEVGEHESYSALLLEGVPTIAPLIKAASANTHHTSIMLTALDCSSSLQELPDLSQHDVILLEFGRADEHTFEILRRLALSAPHKPVIGIVDGRDESMGAQALQAGAEDYILKQELTQEVLLHSIRNAIEHKKINDKRKLQEAASRSLADSQALAKIPEENPNPVLRVSMDGTLVYANDSSAPILNAWKCKVGDLIPDEWNAKISKAYTSRSKKEEIIKFAGHVFSLVLTPIIEAEYLNIYGLDITHHQQVNKNLARIARINENMRSLLLKLGCLNNPDEMMVLLLDAAMEITGMDGGGIYLLEDQDALLHLHKGLPDAFVRAIASMPLSAPPASLALKSDKPLNIYEISENIRSLIYEHGIKHAYSVPLRMGNNVFGFLNLASYRDQPPDEIALHSLWMLALEAGSFFKRAQAEKELRKSAEKYRLLINNANEAIFVAQDGKIKFSNPKLREITGSAQPNLSFLPITKFIHHHDFTVIFDQYDKILNKEGGSSTFELRIVDQEGGIKWLEIHALRINWDEKPAVLNFASEITERKSAEEALKASEERFRLAAHSASDLIFEWDSLSNALEWYGDIDEILGYAPNEFPRTLEAWAKIIHPDDYDRVIATVGCSLKEKNPFSEEYRIRCKDGSYRHWIDSGTPPSINSDNLFKWVRVISDITERKKAEERLREISSRNEALLESVPDIIMEVDKNKVYTWANKAGYEFFGDDVIGKKANYYFEGEQSTFEIIHPLFDGSNDIVCLESWQRRRDGEKRLLSWKCKALKDAQGHVSGALSSARDITESKQMEEALRESRGILRAVLDSIPVRVFWKDKSLKYLGCNTSFARDAGFEKTVDVIGNDDYSMGWREQAELYQADDRLVIESGKARLLIEEPQTTPSGEQIHLLTSKVPLRDADGAIVGVLGTYQDITARKKAEESLRRLATVIEQSADGVVILDIDGCIEYVNPAYERITGNSRDEVHGKLLGIFENNAQNAKIHDDIEESLKSGKTWTGTMQNIKKDGKTFNESITISPVFDTSGALIEYVASMRDITRQVVLEQQLLQSQKMEAIGQLAGGVAHDFNNLLTAILGYSEILRNNLDGQDRLKKDVDEITKASNRAAGLTRQLLAFSRRQIIQPKVLDLNSIVNEMNKMLRRLIGENVELVTEIDDNLWQIKADPGQIEQIIMNLAVNARDAMPGGGKLIIKTSKASYNDLSEAARVKLTPQDYALLTITDTGSGISEEIKPHIFEPFFTTKEQGKGTGLGLATVYGIVEQNSGAIEVDSNVGSGTTFRIYWPRIEEIASKKGKFDPRMESIGGHETILIVEDEEIVRDLTCRLLNGLGYKTLVAGDPREAIKLCKQFTDDIRLLLTDVVMPEMDGEELARAAKIIIPEISVLFMSGYTDNSFIKHKALESLGDFLPKPFSKELLASKVREIIERDASRKAGRTVVAT